MNLRYVILFVVRRTLNMGIPYSQRYNIERPWRFGGLIRGIKKFGGPKSLFQWQSP